MLLTELATACGAGAPTPVPSATSMRHATPVHVPGPQVKYDKVRLTVPNTLASGVNARLAPKSDAGPDAPYWTVDTALFAGYLQAVTRKLDSAVANEVPPSLEAFDTLM